MAPKPPTEEGGITLSSVWASVQEKGSEYGTALQQSAVGQYYAATVKPQLDVATSWGLHVKDEWTASRSYKGSVMDACGCTLGLVDCTWPSCVGLKFRGMVCCVKVAATCLDVDVTNIHKS